MRKDPTHPWWIQVGMGRAIDTIGNKADAHKPTNDPMRERVFAEICQNPAGHEPAGSATTLPCRIPSQNTRTDQSTYLDGISLGNREQAPWVARSVLCHCSLFTIILVPYASRLD